MGKKLLSLKFNGFKLTEGRVRWDIVKKFFPLRVGRPCHRLPKEAVAAPSWEMFKARLEGPWIKLG